MKLTILGSGTYAPEPDRATSGYLLEAGGKKILIDIGRGVLNSLYKAGYSYADIDVIIISHMHPDHFNDLISYLHLFYSQAREDKKRKTPVTIAGPEGFKNNINHLMQSWNRELDDSLKIKELSDNTTEDIEGVKVTGYEVIHSRKGKCLSLRIEHNGKTFAYSGDTSDCNGLRNAINNADLALMEATMPHSSLKGTHLSGYIAGKIAKEENVKKLALTHVKSYYTNIKEEAKEGFNSDAIIAKDLMEIDI